jgi:hypothetical protein
LKFDYTRRNIVRGFLIYASGDTLAALLQHQFSLSRMAGMMLLGATVYAFEIPNYFKWIDTKLENMPTFWNSVQRTGLSVLYFSPLWVFRHLIFIKLLSGKMDEISWDLLRVAAVSFLVNLPVSFSANYLIQNKVALQNRFLASALFSALMAVYYALAANWFK